MSLVRSRGEKDRVDEVSLSPSVTSSYSKRTGEYDPELLIKMVTQYPCILNVKLSAYKNIGIKKVAWDVIYNSFQKAFTGI